MVATGIMDVRTNRWFHNIMTYYSEFEVCLHKYQNITAAIEVYLEILQVRDVRSSLAPNSHEIKEEACISYFHYKLTPYREYQMMYHHATKGKDLKRLHQDWSQYIPLLDIIYLAQKSFIKLSVEFQTV